MAAPSPDKPPIAFLGLGKMGLAMATNLQRAGYPLVVWNRSPERAAPLLEAGAAIAQTPAAAAGSADIVISSLADDASLRAVVSGPDGVLAGLRPAAIHVGTSTISPGLSEELAQSHSLAGGRYLAGPVLGRVPAAEAAQLITFVAGDTAAIESVRAVITTYAPMMLVVGEQQSQAAVAKLIANFLGASGMDLIGQSLAWSERSGLPPALVPQLLSSFFGSPATREYITKIGERDFDSVGFTAAGGRKDVQLMIEAAATVDLRLSSAEALRAKLDAAIARGWRDRDWSCFTEIDRSRTPT
ncbi:MAG TPA: NAD(P)-dependent oxidoreductase [Caulobacteraceae bacterium]|nr:NAD(P)-dependent oxidoreductase [Caulobacteraceae bacterium]